jgi:hypothetical protein
MNKIKARRFFSIILFTSMCIASGCIEDDVSAKQDYFPLVGNREWRYQQSTLLVSFNGNTTLLLDTVRVRVAGETDVEGIIYKEIIGNNGLVSRLVRKEGSAYFARNNQHFLGVLSPEHKFLDLDAPVGVPWSYLTPDGLSKTEYIVKSKSATHEFHGKAYRDVIELDVNYYLLDDDGNYVLIGSVNHLYARDIGEIYNHYPSPLAGFSGTQTTSLLSIQ